MPPPLVANASFEIQRTGHGEGKTGVFGLVLADTSPPFGVSLQSLTVTGKSDGAALPSATDLKAVGPSDGSSCHLLPLSMILGDKGGVSIGDVGLRKDRGQFFLEVLRAGAQVCLEFEGEFDLAGASIAFGATKSRGGARGAGAEAIPDGVEEPVREHWQTLLDRKGPTAKRLRSVKSLGELATGAAVVALMVAVRDPEPAVRTAAVQQLKTMRAPFAQEFPGLAKSDSAATRSAAIEVAGALNLTSGTAQVGTALSDPEAVVRRAAVTAVVEIEGPAAHQRVISALTDDDSSVVCTAAGVLGKVKAESAREALLKGLTGASSMDFRPSQAVVAMDQVLLPGSDGWRCDPGASMALALVRIGTKAAASIRTVLKSDDANTRRRMTLGLSFEREKPGVAKMLLSALDDKDAWIRAMAARSLGQLKEKTARAKLKALAVSDPDSQVVENAREALSALGD